MRKIMNVTLYQPAKQMSRKLLGPAIIGGTGVLLAATSSNADVAAMFAAVDVSTFDANLTTVLTALLGISVMGAGYVYLKRALPGRF